MKRSKPRARSRSREQPVFVLTPESLAIAQQALKEFEQALQRTKGEPVRVAFAREVMQIVRDKLTALGTATGVPCLTTFDYNEKIVLATAMQLYRLALQAEQPTEQRASKLHACQCIEQFALESLNGNTWRTTRD